MKKRLTKKKDSIQHKYAFSLAKIKFYDAVQLRRSDLPPVYAPIQDAQWIAMESCSDDEQKNTQLKVAIAGVRVNFKRAKFLSSTMVNPVRELSDHAQILIRYVHRRN